MDRELESVWLSCFIFQFGSKMVRWCLLPLCGPWLALSALLLIISLISQSHPSLARSDALASECVYNNFKMQKASEQSKEGTSVELFDRIDVFAASTDTHLSKANFSALHF